MSERYPISSQGFVERHGIRAYLTEHSHFGPETGLFMHLEKDVWPTLESIYPEVSAVSAVSDDESVDFCWPYGGECEFHRQLGGQVEIRVYHPSCATPVMTTIFPNPRQEGVEDIYRQFMAPTDDDIREMLSDDNMRHMYQGEMIQDLLRFMPDEVLRRVGSNREKVVEGSIYRGIIVLDHVSDTDEIARMADAHHPGIMSEVYQLLHHINPEDFRTADDY